MSLVVLVRLRARSLRLLLGAVLAVAVLVPCAHAEVVLPAVIGDGMVLQRDTAAPIWGWSDPGTVVVVEASWLDARLETTADDQGAWHVDVPTPAAGGPHELAIVSGGDRRVVRDVLVGEVWVCSGQSNMEWRVAQADGADSELVRTAHPALRLFTVPNVQSALPRRDCEASWVASSPETNAAFSAVGFYFAMALQEQLGVPIGLISADWGGTVVEAWMSEGAVRAFPEFDAALDHLRDIADPELRATIVRERIERWWRDYDGASGKLADWQQPAHDDSGWPEMDLPGSLGPDGLDAFDGVVYFRRTIEIPEGWPDGGATLELGPIDDYDDTWINGVHVGATHEPGQWATPRRYDVPAGVLEAGPAVIAVRVYDTSGPGGINGRPDQLVLRGPGGRSMSLAGAWRYQRGKPARELRPQPSGTNVNPNTPTVLFNGLVAPIVPFAMQGAIWYQGESNRGRPIQYRDLFPAMIADWRAQWGREFPFYFVQIAPFEYRGDTGQAALLREAQLRTLAVPGTGMAVTADIGNPADIHPRNKQEVGRRLALWALARTYGNADLECSGPLFEAMEVDGGIARLRFRHGGGLRLAPAERTHFLVAGADRVFHPGIARVADGAIEVSSPAVAEPVAVRYGWEAASEPNLFNGAGLPASPFRTDVWD